MKWFIDPVVQEATLRISSSELWCLLGFYGKRKRMSTDFDIRHYNPESFRARCFIEHQCSFEWDMDWPRASGHSYQGTPSPWPRWPCKCVELLAEKPPWDQDLGCEVQQIDLLRVGAGSRSRAGKMRFDFVNKLTRYMMLCFSMTNFFKFGTYFWFEKL